MKIRFLKFLAATVLLVALLLALVLPAPAAQFSTAPRVTAALTNSATTLTNGVTTFAAQTNAQFNLSQGKGVVFTFEAYCTNAAQLTFYLVSSPTGTNYVDVGQALVWGNAMVASAWIKRSTNIPASILDNSTRLKILIASNAAATVTLSNVAFVQGQ